ncbi:MAG: helix-hairpin-helix domain-containing protein [Oscillospiraceae bacterium]|nr:helix-hairpin-helix domain-containing protein [Oscillospiraceae bacterium]
MDTKSLLIVIVIGGIAAVMGVAAYAAFGEKLDEALPVMNTLSSEQLAGVGYTSMTAPDDSDIWEYDEDYEKRVTTVVPDVTTEKTEKTEITVSFPLDLNTASAEELMQIDGIGEVLAGRIIDYAEQYGFNEVDDLLNVSGIGESRLESIRPYVCADGTVSEK